MGIISIISSKVAQDGQHDTIKLTSLEELQQIIKKMKVLVATEKPFAKVAVDGIRNVVEGAGYEMALLEKYTDVNELYAAVADADALSITR